jgi:hypothetical protein
VRDLWVVFLVTAVVAVGSHRAGVAIDVDTMGDAGPASASVARPTSVMCTFTDHQPAEARSVTLKLPATVQWSEVNARVQVCVLDETAVVRFAPVAASGGVGCGGGVGGGGGGFVALVVWRVVVVVPGLPVLLPRVQAPAAVLLLRQLLLLAAQLLLLASQVGSFAHAPASPLCIRNQRDKPPPLSPPGASTQTKSSPTSITATTFSLKPPSLHRAPFAGARQVQTILSSDARPSAIHSVRGRATGAHRAALL